MPSNETIQAPEAGVGRSSIDSQGRRRSSQMFAGMHDYKRNPENPRASERRQSLLEHKPAPGVFGGLWNKFTRGEMTK